MNKEIGHVVSGVYTSCEKVNQEKETQSDGDYHF